MARTTDKYGINEEKPTFFKRIAPHVLKHDGNVQPERAVLTWNSSVDCSWTVKVSRTEEGVYFKDGWKEFLNDNSVKEGNFLVFTYEGDMHFSIRYFDKISFNRGDIPTNEAHEESAPAKSTKRNPGVLKLPVFYLEPLGFFTTLMKEQGGVIPLFPMSYFTSEISTIWCFPGCTLLQLCLKKLEYFNLYSKLL